MLKHVRFGMAFTVTIILIMTASFGATGYMLFSVFKMTPENGWLNPQTAQGIGMAVTAVIVTIFLIIFITIRYFKPINALAEALNKVAGGDFSVSLPANGGGNEIDKMNRNFNKMVEELRSIETLQSGFVQNVSHEFKTPLAAISGYAKLLEGMTDGMAESDKAAEYIERISQSAASLTTLTGNILSLSKLENQRIVSEKTVFKLDEQIRMAYLSLEPLWSKRDIDIDMELNETEYVGNESLMFQIWTNLFSNAVKFTPDGGRIRAELKTDRTSGEVILSISDSGIGMNEYELEHIFDRFYQAETNRSSAGNGLGLTLVKKIVELCAGSIAVESIPQKGSVFTVSLPPVKLL